MDNENEVKTVENSPETVAAATETAPTAVNPAPKKKGDKISRSIIAFIMVGVLVGIVYLTKFSFWVFDALVWLLVVFATVELYIAVKKIDPSKPDKKIYNISLPALIVNVVMILPLCVFYGYVGLIITFVTAFCVNFTHFIFDGKKNFTDFCVGTFALVYPAVIMGIVFVLNGQYGMIPVLLAVGISTFSDALAFWIGVLFGKKKIFPSISPKKTYMGCFGGLIGGIIGAVVIYLIFEYAHFPTYIKFTFSSISSVPYVIYGAIGLILAVFSEIGDLGASRIKRQLAIKDFSSALGSHGGVLDRIDSILFTTVCMAIIMFVISAI